MLGVDPSSFESLRQQLRSSAEGKSELKAVQMDHDYDFPNTDSALKRKQQAYLNRMSLNPENCPFQFPTELEYLEATENESCNMGLVMSNL